MEDGTLLKALNVLILKILVRNFVNLYCWTDMSGIMKMYYCANLVTIIVNTG